MGSCASATSRNVSGGPPDHVTTNRNAMYPIKSYDYQRRKTALVFPTVQKDLHPPEMNWSSSSDDDDDVDVANNARPRLTRASSSDSDAQLFSTLRPSEKREQSILPPDLMSPEDIPLVRLHQTRPATGNSLRDSGERSATVKHMESTLVADRDGNPLKRSLREALDEHEEDRRAVQAASHHSGSMNSASRRSSSRKAPPPLTFGVHKDDSDDEYGEL